MTEDEKIALAMNSQSTKSTSIEERRAAAQARIEAAAKKAEEAADLLMLEAEEKLAEIVDTFGPNRARIAVTSAGPVVLMRKEEALYKSLVERTKKGEQLEADVRRFVKACIVYPTDPKDVERLLAEAPAALGPLGNILADLYGHKVSEDRPK